MFSSWTLKSYEYREIQPEIKERFSILQIRRIGRIRRKGIHHHIYLDTISTINRIKESAISVRQKTEFELNKMAGETSKLFANDKCDDITCENRCKFARISAVVLGIELCYAAETAFVSPIIARLGIPISFLSLVWSISPLIGFFLLTLLGSLSDQCQSSLGRRRPFIIGLATGTLLGLTLIAVVPAQYQPISTIENRSHSHVYLNKTQINDSSVWNNMAPTYIIVLTIVGLGIMDSCCDGCQAPARALLVDSVPPKFHTAGLAVFTVVSGAGGTCGYLIGGIDWEGDVMKPGDMFGTNQFFQESMVFAMVGLIFVIATIVTLTSVKEVPLKKGEQPYFQFRDDLFDDDNADDLTINKTTGLRHDNISESPPTKSLSSPAPASLESEFAPESMGFKVYMHSLFRMPRSLAILCLTNLFSWMSLVCYSLLFTHFVGEVIYEGSANAAYKTPSRNAYEKGVRMGSFAMAIYSATACVYSMMLKTLYDAFGIKKMYVLSLLLGSVGMLVIGLFKNMVFCFVFSANMGVLYVSLFTTPYILVSSYHTSAISPKDDYHHTKRGLGTDLTLMSSMLFVGQFTVAISIGLLINFTGTSTTICWASAIFSFIAALLATCVRC